MSRFNQKIILPAFAVALSGLLASCGGGGTDGSDSNVVIAGDKPIAYVERNANSTGNPTDAAICSAGGRLLVRKLSSASASALDVTAQITGGNGDVSDLEVSYDGTKILFTMKPNCGSGTWNIYEYDSTQPPSGSNPKRIIADDAEANKGDDIDPAYVPRDSGDLIVFSSNRQKRIQAIMQINNIEPYKARDEYERELVSVLHTMTVGGDNIRQISFNQSHDRNPTVLSTGEIMYSRWDHVGGRNQFTVFTTNPDGTGMFVFYGAHSGINSLLHPREMPDKQTIISSGMSLSGSREGGALMLINSSQCSENNDCDGNITGQAQATAQEMSTGRGISQFGRATDPYPLFDGSNRVLVSWAASCSAIDIENCPTELNLANNLEEPTEGPAQYGIYMLNLDTKDLDIIDIGSEGKVLRSPVVLLEREKPNGIEDKTLDTTLAAKNSGAGAGILNVKSVYDTDELGRMGNGVLISGDEPSIPQTTAPDGRTVADIAAMKDPDNEAAGDANYKTRPARFIRITKAVPTPSGMGQNDMGETDFEMQQIVGYSEVEPDGSFKIEVPADTPLTISVLDSEGRAFQAHTNWIQVRPGETRTCSGCHSPRRGDAINVSPIAGSHSNGDDLVGKDGETMAETRFEAYPASYPLLKDDISHSDVWVTAAQLADDKNTSAITIDYSGIANAADRPVNGVVNYPEHVQAIWAASRTNTTGSAIVAGDETIADNASYNCTTCHNANTPDDETSLVFQRTAGLDLRGTVGGEGYFTSYSELMVGDPLLDANGLPTVTIAADGQVRIQREGTYVSVASARNSILMAVLTNTKLKAGERQITKAGVLTNESIADISLDHSFMTNASERRVITEWIDMGAQYYNTAFVASAGDDGTYSQSELRSPPSGLSTAVFNTTVHPILMSTCAGCHQAFDGDSATGVANQQFQGRNRFVLTGNPEGDFNITTTLVSDTSTAANNELLSKPTSTDGAVHPQVGGVASGAAIMSIGSADYNAIANWITQ